jgi:hypothetical protein
MPAERLTAGASECSERAKGQSAATSMIQMDQLHVLKGPLTSVALGLMIQMDRPSGWTVVLHAFFVHDDDYSEPDYSGWTDYPDDSDGNDAA